jgi:hypothetical protein
MPMNVTNADWFSPLFQTAKYAWIIISLGAIVIIKKRVFGEDKIIFKYLLSHTNFKYHLGKNTKNIQDHLNDSEQKPLVYILLGIFWAIAAIYFISSLLMFFNIVNVENLY